MKLKIKHDKSLRQGVMYPKSVALALKARAGELGVLTGRTITQVDLVKIFLSLPVSILTNKANLNN